jgi:hypothetical protein
MRDSSPEFILSTVEGAQNDIGVTFGVRHTRLRGKV